MSLLPSTRIALWTPPRCSGTAFHRCIAQLTNIKTFYEPYLEPFFWGDTRVSHRFDNVERPSVAKAYGSTKSVEQTTYDLINDYFDYDGVFFRDHAYHVIHDDTLGFIPKGVLNIYTNTFMIRHPEYQIKSTYKLHANPDVWGENNTEFDQSIVGWTQLFKLFEIVTNELKQEPIVIDASDLMKQPEELLKMYCRLTNLQYNNKMLNWSDEIDGIWSKTESIHGNLNKSKTIWNKNIEYDYKYPQIVYDCIEEVMPYYQQLLKYAITTKEF